MRTFGKENTRHSRNLSLNTVVILEDFLLIYDRGYIGKDVNSTIARWALRNKHFFKQSELTYLFIVKAGAIVGLRKRAKTNFGIKSTEIYNNIKGNMDTAMSLTVSMTTDPWECGCPIRENGTDG